MRIFNLVVFILCILGLIEHGLAEDFGAFFWAYAVLAPLNLYFVIKPGRVR